MPISNLPQLFSHVLSDLYSTEKQIIEALPQMIEASTDEKLRAALQEHLEVTQTQLDRLNTIKQTINFDTDMVCDGIKGVLTEGQKSLAEITDLTTKDAAIIASAQKVEHYEMATYGTAQEFARLLEYDDEAQLLEESLNEEKKADSDLSTLAKGNLFKEGLNQEALSA